jgi:hypothetical protein
MEERERGAALGDRIMGNDFVHLRLERGSDIACLSGFHLDHPMSYLFFFRPHQAKRLRVLLEVRRTSGDAPA